MISNRQKLVLTYFLSRCVFLGIGYSLIFDKAHQDSWMCVIIGTMIGFLVIKIYKIILDKKEGYTLKEYLNEFKSFRIIKIFIIIYSILFILILLTILNSFISSFFLLNSPPYFITILFLIIAFFLAIRGIKNIAKTAEIFIFISIFVLILVVIALFKYIDINNLLPVFSVKFINIFKSSIAFSIYSTAPCFFILNIKNNGKNIDKFYLFNIISIFLVIVITMLILGRNLTDIYRFPEYMVLKRIKIFSFIEKVENIVSCVLITDEIFSMSMALYTIYDFINKNKLVLMFLILGIFVFESFAIANNYTITLLVYYYALYILAISFLVIIVPLIIAKKKMD